MADNYYFLDIIDKKGPYSLEELRSRSLPLDTLIWKEGWNSPKRISECEDILRYFLLTPPSVNCSQDTSYSEQHEPERKESIDEEPTIEPDVHTTASVENHQVNDKLLSHNASDPQSESVLIVAEVSSPSSVEDEQDDIEIIHPEMHWFPKTLMILGIFGGFAQITRTCSNFLFISPIVIITSVALSLWGIASIIGMINKRRWGLISFFSYRLVGLIFNIIIAFENSSTMVELCIDIISLLMIIGIFFIKKDGHNTYDLLWHNGVFYALKVKEESANNGEPEYPQKI